MDLRPDFGFNTSTDIVDGEGILGDYWWFWLRPVKNAMIDLLQVRNVEEDSPLTHEQRAMVNLPSISTSK